MAIPFILFFRAEGNVRFLQHGTIVEPAPSHFLINSLSNRADQNISTLNPSISGYPFPKRTHLQVTQKLLGESWVTGSSSSFVRLFSLSSRIGLCGVTPKSHPWRPMELLKERKCTYVVYVAISSIKDCLEKEPSINLCCSEFSSSVRSVCTFGRCYLLSL